MSGDTWGGVTYLIGGEKHMMPMDEFDVDHVIKPGEECDCKPTRHKQQTGNKHLPWETIVRHNPIRGKR